MVTRATAAAVGLLADRLVGEPPEAWHPVVAFGQTMQRVEDRVYADRRAAGALHTAAGVLIGVVAGRAVRATTVATWSAVAGRCLRESASAVGQALTVGDLEAARALLPTLVGRDPASLDATDIARAAVESVAENTVDAMVAPAMWAAVAGAPGVLAHRAINTMDAMVGHHDDRYERYGWASARADDLAAWIPARATALLVMACRPRSAALVAATVRRDAPPHPSPNSGVAEAAFAAALGVRLGGESRYGDRVELRPQLGDGRPCEPADIERAVRLSSDVSDLLAAVLVMAGMVSGRRRRRRGGT